MVLYVQNNMESNLPEIRKDMLVKDTMSRNFSGVDSHSTVLEAARKIARSNTDSVIVTQNGDSLGIITGHDIIVKTVIKNVLPSEMTAGEIMSSPIITAKPSTDIIEAAEMMVKYNIRRLAVMENDSIVGMITDRDILAIAPGLTAILEGLIELNNENNICKETDIERGICQRCGALVDNLTAVNGLMLCEDCKEEEGYYD